MPWVAFSVENDIFTHALEIAPETTCAAFVELAGAHLSRTDLARVCVNGAVCDPSDALPDLLSDRCACTVGTEAWSGASPRLQVRLFGTADRANLTEGLLLNLPLTCTPAALAPSLLRRLFGDRADSLACDLYLPGGFLWRGKAPDLSAYRSQNFFNNWNIYAVFYRAPLFEGLDSPAAFPLADAGWLSPLHAARPERLHCALLGLRGGGAHSFVRSVAFFCPFAPLIVGLHRLAIGAPMDGHCVVAITGSLACLIEALVKVPPEEALDYCLQCLAFLSLQYAADVTVCREFQIPASARAEFLFVRDIERDSIGLVFWPNPDRDEVLKAAGQTQFMKPLPVLAASRVATPFLADFGGEVGVVTDRTRHSATVWTSERGFAKISFAELIPLEHPPASRLRLPISRDKCLQIVLLCIENPIYKTAQILNDFLKMYENQVFRFRTSTIHALMVFPSARILVPFGTVTDGFAPERIERRDLKEPSQLKEAIIRGVSALLSFAFDETGPWFLRAQLRLILIASRMRDFDSKSVEHIVLNSHVTLDLLTFAPQSPDDVPRYPLVGLCHRSGGHAICVDRANLKTVVESEPFLNITVRHRLPNHDSFEFDLDFPHRAIQHGSQATEMRLAAPGLVPKLPKAAGNRTQRIAQELRYAAQLDDPSIKVFATDAIDEWRAFITGPPGTPYARYWWYVLVTFPAAYPQDPPQFRFISVPFHVNVSDAGRICLNVLEREYTRSSVVFEMLVCVRALLQLPNYDDPIDLDRKRLAAEDMAAFTRRARSSCSAAKRSIDDWLAVLASP
jgi:ubiquitin-protein ligase